jgi:hypothetical protein
LDKVLRTSPMLLALCENNMRVLYLIFFVILAAGCATTYDTLQPLITVGASEAQVEKYLSDTNTPYSFFTCKEYKSSWSVPAKQCKFYDSIGVYQALANDGSYILGMGSTGVQLAIEIGPSKKVVHVGKDDVHTFL